MRTLFLFLSLIPVLSFSQKIIDIDTVKFDFSEVVQADSMSAKTLYSNAKLFLSNAFIHSKNNIQLEEESTNTLFVRGYFTYPLHNLPLAFSYMKYFTTSFKLQIRAKDGRYKYTLSDFIVLDNAAYQTFDLSLPYTKQKGETGQAQHRQLWYCMKGTAYEYAANFIDSLKNGMIAKDDF